MLKKRYAALMIVSLLVGGAALVKYSVSATVDPAWTSNANISAEKAEEIALNELGLTRDQVVMDRTEADRERGRYVWEVEIYHNGIEYDFEINADSGEILKQKQENERRSSAKPSTDPAPAPTPTPDADAPDAPSADALTEEQAIAIALDDAGLTADQVTRLKVEKDFDDGAWEYEIEFKKDGMEYDYEIRISDSKILQRDIEWDD